MQNQQGDKEINRFIKSYQQIAFQDFLSSRHQHKTML